MMISLANLFTALTAVGVPPEMIVAVVRAVIEEERRCGQVGGGEEAAWRRHERERKRASRARDGHDSFARNHVRTFPDTCPDTCPDISGHSFTRNFTRNNPAYGIDRPSKSNEDESKEGVVESGCRGGDMGSGEDGASLLSPHTPLSSLSHQEDLLGSDITPLREETLTQSNLSEYTRARSKNHANSSRSPEKRATRIAPDWEPGERGLAYAAQHGLVGEDLRDEIAKFKNYWESKGGRDAAKLDWAATWRNWVLNWKTVYGGKRHHHGAETRRRSAADDFFAGFDEAAAHLFGHSSGAWGASGEIPPGRINIDGRAAGGSHEDG